MNNTEDYKKIGEFSCRNELMVTIRAAHGTHVMSEEDWTKLIQVNDKYNKQDKVVMTKKQMIA